MVDGIKKYQTWSVPAVKTSGKQPPAAAGRNSPAVMEEDGLRTDREAQLRAAAEEVRQALPGVSLRFSMLERDAVYQFAASAPAGLHLTVAPDYLEWMLTGPESWREGMDFLGRVLGQLADEVASTPGLLGAGAVIGENGEVSLWTTRYAEESGKEEVPDPFDPLKQLEEKKKQFEKLANVKRKIGYVPGRDLARLANAGTLRDVRSLMAKIYARSVMLKGNSRYDKNEVKMTVGQMEAVISRARVKVKKLKEESLMESARKKAEKQKQQERAARLKAELEKARTLRRSREYAQISERFASWYPPETSSRKVDGRRDPDEEPLTVPGGESVPVGGGAAPVPSGTAGTGTVTVAAPGGGAVSVTVSAADVSA